MKENTRKGMVSLQIITPKKEIRVPSPSERMASAWESTGKAFIATGRSMRTAINNG